MMPISATVLARAVAALESGSGSVLIRIHWASGFSWDKAEAIRLMLAYWARNN